MNPLFIPGTTCDGCGAGSLDVVQVGEEPEVDGDKSTAQLCRVCVEAALAMFPGAQRGKADAVRHREGLRRIAALPHDGAPEKCARCMAVVALDIADFPHDYVSPAKMAANQAAARGDQPSRHDGRDPVDAAWERGAVAAADVASQYNASSTHPYRIDDCILGKLNVRKEPPRPNDSSRAMAALLAEAAKLDASLPAAPWEADVDDPGGDRPDFTGKWAVGTKTDCSAWASYDDGATFDGKYHSSVQIARAVASMRNLLPRLAKGTAPAAGKVSVSPRVAEYFVPPGTTPWPAPDPETPCGEKGGRSGWPISCDRPKGHPGMHRGGGERWIEDPAPLSDEELESMRKTTCTTNVYASFRAGNVASLLAEVRASRALLNAPELHDFTAAIVREAAHQRKRWPSEHDAGKAPSDWFWLLGYLAGKALHAHAAGNVDKALHHTISSAAALANWHAALLGKTDMRPGIDAPVHDEDKA